jgi:hypothetical protein
MLILSIGILFAQFNPYVTQNDPQDPRVRRAAREQVVARVGEESRGLVEAYDEAVVALGHCSVPVAKRLSLFYSQGGLDRFPRPRDFLVMLTQQRGNADDVCLWALQPQNVEKLRDVDYFDAYLASPLEYALALSSLPDGAAKSRANRLGNQSSTVSYRQGNSSETEASVRAGSLVLGVVAVGVGLVVWFWRRGLKPA